MKFLRLGSKGKEIPAIVDDEINYRDLSSLIDDFKPSTLNFEILKKIKDLNISKIPVLPLYPVLSQNLHPSTLCILISSLFHRFTNII